MDSKNIGDTEKEGIKIILNWFQNQHLLRYPRTYTFLLVYLSIGIYEFGKWFFKQSNVKGMLENWPFDTTLDFFAAAILLYFATLLVYLVSWLFTEIIFRTLERLKSVIKSLTLIRPPRVNR